MADLSKLKNKKKSRFGGLPVPEETNNNLTAPETAPSKLAVKKKVNKKPVREQQARAKTGRTIAFGTRVSEEFLQQFNETAYTAGLKKVELLEVMLKEYCSNK